VVVAAIRRPRCGRSRAGQPARRLCRPPAGEPRHARVGRARGWAARGRGRGGELRQPVGDLPAHGAARAGLAGGVRGHGALRRHRAPRQHARAGGGLAAEPRPHLRARRRPLPGRVRGARRVPARRAAGAPRGGAAGGARGQRARDHARRRERDLPADPAPRAGGVHADDGGARRRQRAQRVAGGHGYRARARRSSRALVAHHRLRGDAARFGGLGAAAGGEPARDVHLRPRHRRRGVPRGLRHGQRAAARAPHCARRPRRGTLDRHRLARAARGAVQRGGAGAARAAGGGARGHARGPPRRFARQRGDAAVRDVRRRAAAHELRGDDELPALLRRRPAARGAAARTGRRPRGRVGRVLPRYRSYAVHARERGAARLFHAHRPGQRALPGGGGERLAHGPRAGVRDDRRPRSDVPAGRHGRRERARPRAGVGVQRRTRAAGVRGPERLRAVAAHARERVRLPTAGAPPRARARREL
ncbi:MAG: hypothetical protein AVDCRST_MAG40-1816, partial [uncultured Gemmatimonadaceae bacterium]